MINSISSENKLYTSLQRLSSGVRINSAKDDPSGLAVVTRQVSEIGSAVQLSSNLEDGKSLAAVYEGYLASATNSFQRLRELSLQSSNGTLNDGDRKLLQNEANQIVEGLKNLASSSDFNGVKLLNGSSSEININIDASPEGNVKVNLLNLNEVVISTSFDVSTQASASASLGGIDAASSKVGSFRAELGAIENRLSASIDGLYTNAVNLSAAKSRILDADYASETTNFATENIKERARFAMLAYSNQNKESVLALFKTSA